MENREHILDCALRLFAARGFDAVGVQEIVELAGVTKPTLYHYFGSKRGLLETLLSSNYSQLDGLLQMAAQYMGDLPLTLNRVVAVLFDFARANPAFYRLQLALWFAPRESEGYQVVDQLNRVLYGILEQLFLVAVNDHGNMRGRHQAYAITLLGMANTYIAMGLNGLIRLDEHLVEAAVHQFQHGIYS
jgi:AcrR family transcriptional regulator